MLDRNLAKMYDVTTGNLNKAVKRNLKRLPEDFMFQVTTEEFQNLIFQNGTSSQPDARQVGAVQEKCPMLLLNKACQCCPVY